MADSQTRLYLQQALEDTFPDLTVYFSPPKNLILDRPCIVYTITNFEPTFANNTAYSVGTQFQISFLSDNPGFSKDDVRPIFDIKNLSTRPSSVYVQNEIQHVVFTSTLT